MNQNATIIGTKNKTFNQDGLDQQQNIQNKYIKHVQTSSQYNSNKIDEIKTTFQDFLCKLKDFQLIGNINQQQQYIEKKNAIDKMIDEIYEQINSIKQKLNEMIFQSQPKNEIQHEQIQSHQTPQQQDTQIQDNKDQNFPKPGNLVQNNKNTDVDKLNTQQKNENKKDNSIQNENQKYPINHQLIQEQQKDQFILKCFLELNMKGYTNKYLKCICDKNIKINDLTCLSNKNLFELLLSQQIKDIFQIKNNMKVLRCKNSFCTFKCILQNNVEKIDQKRFNFYCPVCEEDSVQ